MKNWIITITLFFILFSICRGEDISTKSKVFGATGKYIKATKYEDEYVIVAASSQYQKYVYTELPDKLTQTVNTNNFFTITTQVFNILAISSEKFVFAMGEKFYILDVDNPDVNASGITFTTETITSPFISLNLRRDSKSFIVVSTSGENGKVSQFSFTGSKVNSGGSGNIGQDSFNCVSSAITPYITFCVYVIHKSINYDYTIYFDSNLERIFDKNLNKDNNLEPGVIPGYGIRIENLGDDKFVLCILKNNDFYCAGGRITENGGVDYAVNKVGGGRLIPATPCQQNIASTALTGIDLTHYAVACVSNTDSKTIIFSFVEINSSFDQLYIIEKKEFTDDATVSLPSIFLYPTREMALLYSKGEEAKMYQIEEIKPTITCENISLNGRVNSKLVVIDISSSITVTDSYYSSVKSDLFLKINAPATGSTVVADLYFNPASTTPTRITSLTDTYTLGSVSLGYRALQTVGTTVYTYTVSSLHSTATCNLSILVEDCQTGCITCSVKGSAQDTKCVKGCLSTEDVSCTKDSSLQDYCAEDYYVYSTNSGWETLPDQNCVKKDTEIEGYYADDTTKSFKTCNVACVSCNGEATSDDTNCKVCKNSDGYYGEESKTSNCLKGASDGYFIGDDNLIHPCDVSCKTCSKTEANCIACNTNGDYVPIDGQSNKCILSTTDLDGYYYDSNLLKFVECSEACQTCTAGEANSKTNCKACKTDPTDQNKSYFPKKEDRSQCILYTKAPKGYYFYKDSTDAYFEKCHEACETCITLGDDSSTKCTKCASGFYPKADDLSTDQINCYGSIPSPGNFFLNSNFKYEECNVACSKCKTKNSVNEKDTQCEECANGYAFVVGKDKVCQLIDQNDPSSYEGYYYDSQDNKYYRCNEACVKCEGQGEEDNTNCLVDSAGTTYCSSGYIIVEGNPKQCYLESADRPGYYVDNNMFKKCQTGCIYCSKAEDGTANLICNECDLGYYALQKDEDSQGTGLECYNENNKPDHTYIDYEENLILECHEACATCTKGGVDNVDTRCTSCSSGYFPVVGHPDMCLDEDSRCESSEDRCYFLNSDNKYELCGGDCYDCDITNDDCRDCNEDFALLLDDDTNKYSCASTKPLPTGYFVDPDSEPSELKKCHESCATCSEAADESDPSNIQAHCTTCADSTQVPNLDDGGNCVSGCTDPVKPYYYKLQGKVVCDVSCPDNFLFTDMTTKECVNVCDPPKYQYSKQCLDYCPDYTELESENSHTCVDLDVCKKVEELNQDTLKSITTNIDTYAKDYCVTFANTDKTVKVLENVEGTFSVIMFKNEDCASSTGGDLMMMDLANCPKILKEKYSIPESEPFITVKLTIPREGSTNQISYGFYHSKTCEKLDLNYCKEEKVVINVPVNTTEGVDIKEAKELAQYGVDVYNSSDPFFNDICFQYTASNGKDVTLKDRRKEYYQNVSFCEEGCEYGGMNLTSEEAICECKVKTDYMSEILDNPLTEDFLELIQVANFEVLVCYEDVFKPSFAYKNAGSWIIIILLLVQVGFCAMYIKVGLMPIRIYLLQFSNVNPPVRSDSTFEKPNFFGEEKNYFEGLDIEESPAVLVKPKMVKIPGLKSNFLEDEGDSSKKLKETQPPKVDKTPPIFKRKFRPRPLHKNVRRIPRKGEKEHLAHNEKGEKEGEGIEYNIESIEGDFDFSDGELNELEMEDAAVHDKRPFCVFYWQQVKEQQEIISTFIYPNELDLLPIRAVYFFFKVALYFTLNGLFYSEDEISAQFYGEGNDFFSLFKNEFVRMIYASMVAMMVNFCMSFLTSSRTRLEMLIKREKDPDVFRKESLEAVHSMKTKTIVFYVLNFLFMLLFWYYISAFCNCYTNTQRMWLIGTFVTWGVIQVVPFILCFIVAVFRYVGMKCKIEFLYNISACLTE